LCIFAIGCPGGEEEAVDGTGGTPAVTNGSGTSTNTGPRKQFKEGIESGRAEDGSDEDK
jgi:hypothetical protein